MKRLVVAAVVAVALVLLVSGLAFADGGPHGGYTATEDACAGCHRAHTAKAPKLLVQAQQDLCLSCHGSIGAGADTNVADGVFLERDGITEDPVEGVVDRGLKGGGFLNTLMNTDFNTIGGGTTSMHTYDGTPATAWGNGAISSGPGLAGFTLECANCHDPHGNGNYRILRKIAIDSGATTAVDVPDEVTKNYTIADPTGLYIGEGYTGTGSREPMSDQYRLLTDWCAQCHTRYMAETDAGITDSGDAIFAYRHSTAESYPNGTCNKCHGQPFNPPFITRGEYFNHQVECMTCHVAHGTSATLEAGGYSESVPLPDGIVLTGSERSSLLRLDGRGTCQACHEKL